MLNVAFSGAKDFRDNLRGVKNQTGTYGTNLKPRQKQGKTIMPWGAIAEFLQTLGAFALVISLIHIGFQIRFARLAAADTSRTVRGEGDRETDLAMVNNRELRETWIKSSNLNSIVIPYRGADDFRCSVRPAIFNRAGPSAPGF